MKIKNNHIERYLNRYLNINNPEFAILLNGKWGSGKTFFIDNYINKNKDTKFIKISLFGLNKVSQIDDEIFNIIHPILSSKYAKFAGSIVKSGLKFGMNFDLNNDGKSDGKFNIDLDDLELPDDDKNKYVFVFDDLERTKISLEEVLGYINYFVEQLSSKVIIIANDEEIIDKNNFKKFKEKVIGKTFEIQQNFDDILEYFIKDNTKDNLQKILLENKKIISEVYLIAKHNNLRHIKQTLLDFLYLYSFIEEQYTINCNFINDLIKIFFILSIEIKAGTFDKNDLIEYDNIKFLMTKNSDDEKKDYSKIESMLVKYQRINHFQLLFKNELLVDILFESSINKVTLNNNILNLKYFENNKNKESFEKLFDYYHNLEDKEFNEIFEDVKSKFNENKYVTPEKILHVFGLLLSLIKNGIYEFQIDTLIKQTKKNIDILKNSEFWEENLFRYERTNSYSFSYFERDSTEFNEILMYLEKQSTISFKRGLKYKANILLNNYLNNELLIANEKLNNEFRYIPIFSNMDYNKYIKIIQNIKHNYLYTIMIDTDRYNIFYLNSNPELVEDFEFWNNVYNNILNNISKKDKPLKYFRLNNFKEHIKSDILDNIEKYKKENR
jgi:hypothetical protein